MYSAKQQGPDRIEVFKPAMRSQKIDQLTIESDLRRALEREELSILYQPIIRLEDRTVAGFEALLRWNHPKLGRVGPAEFIPIAEESGLIQEIGTWVIRRALAQTAEWQAAGLPVVPVAVNLSVVQFRHPGLRDSLAEALRDSGLPAAMLELELTESVAMEDSTFTIATIAGSGIMAGQMAVQWWYLPLLIVSTIVATATSFLWVVHVWKGRKEEV
jgi:sensor c-di-GMP phosphodiesterase-like protein